MLNWRPVVDYELRESEYEQRMLQLQNESEQLRIEEQQRRTVHEQRMKQIENEMEHLDPLNSKIDALLFSCSTSSISPQSTPGNSEL